MPQAIPVAIAALGATGAVGFGVQLASIWFLESFAAPLLLTGAAGILAKKPKTPSFDFGRVATDRTISARSPIATRKTIYGRARVGGTIVFAESTNDNDLLHLVIALASHECEEIQEVWFDDEKITLSGNAATGKYADHAWVYKHLGTSGQAVDASLNGYLPSRWTVDHRLRGICYLYVRLKSNRDLFANGVPNISAVVKGKKLFDPRTSTTAWSDNPALCLYDYLTDTVYGLGADPSEIDSTALEAAANLCEESVNLAGGGTEDRYTCNGVIDWGDEPKDNIQSLLTSMAGKAIHAGGVWVIKGGEYEVPSVTLDESDARGPIEVTTRITRANIFNAVKGVYVSEANNWQPADFPAITNIVYLQNDNNERIWRDIDLRFTTSSSMAQRLAKIELEKARQQIVVRYPCKLSALQLMAGDTVALTNTRFGWNEKAFEVEDWQFVQIEDDEGNPALGVDLVLRETASTVYSWNSGEETTVDPAPDTNLPNPFAVSAPTGLNVSSELASTGTGDETYLATVAWDLHTNAFVRNGGRIEIQWREESENNYRPSWFVDGAATEAKINQLEVGISYDVRVRAHNYFGARSTWSTLFGFNVTSPSGATTQLDYGEFSEAVSQSLDYGEFSDLVDSTLDYGEFA